MLVKQVIIDGLMGNFYSLKIWESIPLISKCILDLNRYNYGMKMNKNLLIFGFSEERKNRQNSSDCGLKQSVTLDLLFEFLIDLKDGFQ